MRRVIAAVTVCTVGIALAGCTGPSPDAAPSPSATGAPSGSTGPTAGPSASPSAPASSPAETRRIATLLAGSVRRLGRTTFTFSGGTGITQVSGAYDLPHRRADLTGTFGLGTGEIRVLGADLYTKGVDPHPQSWTHLDTRRLATGNLLSVVTAPTVGTAALGSIDAAAETSPGHYSGTVDVPALARRATRHDRGAATLLRLLGQDPATVTFDAAVAPAGDLTDLVLNAPASAGSPRSTVSARFSGYGAKVTVARPAAAQVEEAPAHLYAVLAPPTTPASPTASATGSPG